jgi:hypothetical protein
MSDETQEPEIVEAIDTPEVDTPEVEAAPVREWTDEDADEARAFGWKAPDEWKGDIPPTYIDDPRRYMERAEKFTPFRKLAERQEQLERDFAERTRKLEAVAESTLKAQQERHKQELARIAAEQRRAVDLADVATYDRLEKEKASLAPPVIPDAPQAPATDPYLQEYAKANDWVNNPILREAGARIIDANPAIRGADTKAQIAYAEAEVRKLYPGYFPQATTQATATASQPRRVDAGGLAGGGGSGSGFTKLPPEAKSAFERFAKEGIFENTEAGRKAYADEYNRA